MEISFCIPCMNRVYDLERTMPYIIAAANASPPAEIAVLDYNSSDGLRKFMEHTIKSADLNGTRIVYTRYEGREYYHIAHAWNLAVRSSTGDTIVIMGADAIPSENYVEEVRKRIRGGCTWMRGKTLKGILAIRRDEFYAAGGYDERLEFYSGEDKEFEARLIRRGHQPCIMPNDAMRVLRTGRKAKVANFRPGLSKKDMMTLGRRIREKNVEEGVLVANEGKRWGVA